MRCNVFYPWYLRVQEIFSPYWKINLKVRPVEKCRRIYNLYWFLAVRIRQSVLPHEGHSFGPIVMKFGREFSQVTD